MIKLSICIPTYNRKRELKEAVEGILVQLSDAELKNSVEIIISDNCSTDNTEEFVENLKENRKDIRIVYHRNKENIGADRNFLKVVELACGEYCWIVGSDDKLCEGSILRMVQEIEYGHTVYLLNRYNCTKDSMEIIDKQYFLKEEISCDTVFYFENEILWDYYINNCNSIGGLFSYLTAVVFKREAWNNVENYQKYIGLSFIHVAKIIQMLLNDKLSSVKYIVEPLVMDRKENDSFKKNDYQRFLLDIDGFITFSEMFESDLLKKDFKAVLKRTHPIITFGILLKSSKKQREELSQKMKQVGYSALEIDLYEKIGKHKIASIIMNSEKIIKKLKKK